MCQVPATVYARPEILRRLRRYSAPLLASKRAKWAAVILMVRAALAAWF